MRTGLSGGCARRPSGDGIAVSGGSGGWVAVGGGGGDIKTEEYYGNFIVHTTAVNCVMITKNFPLFSNNHNFPILKNYYGESEMWQKLDALL